MPTTLLKGKKRNPSNSFVGSYEVTVLGDRRIILPADVIRQFRDHSTKRVFPGRLPGSKAIVLCPVNLWDRWTNKLKKKFPCLKNLSGARIYLVPWQPISWDSKGRITLPRRAREYAGIKAEETVIIMGTDYCFELWSEKEFNEILKECETALRKLVKRRLSIVNIVSPPKSLQSD